MQHTCQRLTAQRSGESVANIGRVSQRRACFIVGQPRRTLSYRKRDVIEAPITKRVRELAEERPRFGWRRLLIMVRREVPIGEFRFRRIYRELHLQVRPRKKRKVRYLRGNMVAFELPNGRILFSIGDVAGHGLEAAVVMSRTRQAIIAASLGDKDPAQVLQRANESIMLQDSRMVVTAICGYINPATLEVTYATAGHPAPVLARPANRRISFRKVASLSVSFAMQLSKRMSLTRSTAHSSFCIRTA